MMSICEYHISNVGSINYASVLLNKQLVSLDKVTNMIDINADLDFMLSNEGEQDGTRADFWMDIHNFKSIDEFREVAGNNLDKFKEHNEMMKNELNKYCHMYDNSNNFLTDKKKDSKKLLKYFDGFQGDGNASKRIVDYLEKA